MFLLSSERDIVVINYMRKVNELTDPSPLNLIRDGRDSVEVAEASRLNSSCIEWAICFGGDMERSLTKGDGSSGGAILGSSFGACKQF